MVYHYIGLVIIALQLAVNAFSSLGFLLAVVRYFFVLLGGGKVLCLALFSSPLISYIFPPLTFDG
jgi:hypothetical protein